MAVCSKNQITGAPVTGSSSGIIYSYSVNTSPNSILMENGIHQGDSLTKVVDVLDKEISAVKHIINPEKLTPQLTELFIKFMKLLSDKKQLALMLTSPDSEERETAELIMNYTREQNNE